MIARLAMRAALYAPYLLLLIGLLYLFNAELMFTAIFTVAGTVQVAGFLLVLRQIQLNNSVSGLSLCSIQAYTIVFGIRSILFLFYHGYLPLDKTGDYLFQVQ